MMAIIFSFHYALMGTSHKVGENGSPFEMFVETYNCIFSIGLAPELWRSDGEYLLLNGR